MSPSRRDRHNTALAIAAPLLALMTVAAPARAQTFSPAPGMSTGRQDAAPPDRVTGTPGTTGGTSHGVIVPHGGVDPGMKVIAPRMPKQSTPVIKPPTSGNGGKDVIVPR